MNQLPLLIQGYALTQAATSSISRSQFSLTKNRGEIIALDPLTATVNPLLSNMSVAIGGVNVLENELMSQLTYESAPAVYQFPEGIYRGGQTMNVVLDNSNNPISTMDGFVHCMHENMYDTPEMMARLDRPFLGLKTKSFSQTVIAGAKGVTQSAVLPKNQGQIIAVQIIGDVTAATLSTYLPSTITLRVNGIEVIIDTSLGLAGLNCSRPYIIFPIQIDPASPIDIVIDNNGAASLTAGIRFFFDSVHAQPLNEC